MISFVLIYDVVLFTAFVLLLRYYLGTVLRTRQYQLSTLLIIIMYTLLQKNADNSFDVVAKVTQLDVAKDLACTLCNQAGVVRTVVMDEWGMIVSAES